MSERNDKSDRYNKLLALTQAALLHDIGKLLQRANDHKEFSDDIAHEYCPSWNSKKYTHQHVLWTLEFFECLVGEGVLAFPKGYKFSDQDVDTLQNIACKHHAPDDKSHWQKILQLADWCSSAMDRTKSQDSKIPEIKDGTYKTKPLLAPWSDVNVDGQKANETVYDFSLLSPHEKKGFSKKSLHLNPKQIQEQYKKLADHFIECLEKANEHFGSDVTKRSLKIDALLSALEHTTWCVPSSTIDLPNISLFDHSKTTAAIAVCLADYYMNGEGKLNFNFLEAGDQVVVNDTLDDKPFRFLVIDLAGIQDYIYDMNKSGFKGMAKVLRGRSFFVNAILEGIEIVLLETLGLPRIVRLMDAGGKLIFLLPNRDGLENTLNDFRKKLEQGLMDQTHGKLKVLFGLGDAFGFDCFLANKEESGFPLNTVYKSAFKALDKAKLRPYSTVVGTIGDHRLDKVIFDKNGSCDICGKQPGIKKWKEESDFYCQSCFDQRNIGKDLLERNFVVFEENHPQGFQIPGTQTTLRLSQSISGLYKANSVGFLWNQDTDYDKAKGHRIVYKANYAKHCNKEEIALLNEEVKETRIEENDLLTFEHLAVKAKLDGAARYIAGVSGDVDNMGDLFEGLLERETAPLTMAVSVSRQFDFFFSGILDSHLRNSKKNIYTVYAGGDDLFYIGAWNEILDEVSEWRKLFGEYVAHHPKITFSAGISLHHPSLPINRIRHDAEEQLKQAKNANKNDPKDKNRICIWDTPMKWKEEWDEQVMMYCKKILTPMNSDELKTAMAYRLLDYSRSAKKAAEKSSKSSIKDWMWGSRLRYDFARNWKKDGSFKNGLKELGTLLESFYGTTGIDPKKVEIFGKKFPIALMMALYLVRNKNTQKGE